jgi:hypothetical protein
MKHRLHWTPKYIYSRLMEIAYQHRYPEYPWLTKAANTMMESLLNRDDVGLEFGSGRSTIWFAKKVKFLTSIEHNSQWFAKVTAIIQKEKIENVRYILAPETNMLGETLEYLAVFNDFNIESVDFVLVDGIYRDICACSSAQYIKPGGIIIIDNVNWYLPSNSFSPNSKCLADGPASTAWKQFSKITKTWRCEWTTNGVSDTAIFFKPLIH